MSSIATFYSYKGGVGRSFALANIAVLLAKRGKRVLVIDWDLEAPGIHRYFSSFFTGTSPRSLGLIHLLNMASQDPNAQWEQFVSNVRFGDGTEISIIESGDQAADYADRVRAFSWAHFFEECDGGTILERWRNEWKRDFDFILADSRTGITDTGGVCTVLLPDILVLVFCANEQSFEGALRIAVGVQQTRRNLGISRPPATILPVPSRFDGRDEVDEAKQWLERFARELRPFYDDWLPKRFKPRQIIELTKIPYVTKFSFGEPLPVLTHGVSDPEFPGFYLENIARLLASDFRDAAQIIAPGASDGDSAVSELRAQLARVPIDETTISKMLEPLEYDLSNGSRFAELLNEAAVGLLRQARYDSAEKYCQRAIALSDRQDDVSVGVRGIKRSV